MLFTRTTVQKDKARSEQSQHKPSPSRDQRPRMFGRIGKFFTIIYSHRANDSMGPYPTNNCPGAGDRETDAPTFWRVVIMYPSRIAQT